MERDLVYEDNQIFRRIDVFDPGESELRSDDLGLVILAGQHLVNFILIDQAVLLILGQSHQDVLVQIAQLGCFDV